MTDAAPSTVGWTDERVDFLKTRWKAGDSCSQIARELGGVTRNSIIGKVHRLGLSGRVKAERKPEAPRVRTGRAKTKPAWRVIHKHKYNQTPPDLLAERTLAAEDRQAQFSSEAGGGVADAFDAAFPGRQRKTIWQLENKHCRFPVGDPGTPSFFFCGGTADNAAGQVYCAEHSARCSK